MDGGEGRGGACEGGMWEGMPGVGGGGGVKRLLTGIKRRHDSSELTGATEGEGGHEPSSGNKGATTATN